MSKKSLEILHEITEACLYCAVAVDAPLGRQLIEAGWSQKLRTALHAELDIEIAARDIESESLLTLSEVIETRLARNPTGHSLIDIYVAIEQFVREEVPHAVNFGWYATWIGDVLNETDSLEDVEIILRMEEEFGFSISDIDAQALRTIAQTVRYLWQRSSEQTFAPRQCPKEVCCSIFIFNELRRLLKIHGGVPRKAVRLNARLGDLLPSQYLTFWKQIENIFEVKMPRSDMFTWSIGLEKRITIKKLVSLIVAAKTQLRSTI